MSEHIRIVVEILVFITMGLAALVGSNYVKLAEANQKEIVELNKKIVGIQVRIEVQQEQSKKTLEILEKIADSIAHHKNKGYHEQMNKTFESHMEAYHKRK